MRLPTSRARYRAAIVTLAGVALATGVAGVGIIAAEASPSAPAAAPALIPCPVPLPLPGLCDSPTPSASPSVSASASPTVSASSTATVSPTVSSTLSVTPTVTATQTAKPTPTSTPGTGAHKPLAGFSYQSASGSHPTRVVITLLARGSKITKLTHVKLQHCTWSLGKPHTKAFKPGKRKVRIVVNRNHESTKGHVRFNAVDAAHQHRVVKATV
jgi:hypothetical protein